MTQYHETVRPATPPLAAPYQYLVLHASLRNDFGKLAVMAAHAAGEAIPAGFYARAPVDPDTRVIALVAATAADLEAAHVTLKAAGVECVLIREPDPPYHGAAVALGCAPYRDRDRVRPFLGQFGLLR